MRDRINRRTLIAGSALAVVVAAQSPLGASASSTGSLDIPNSPLGRQIAWALGLFTGKPTGLTDADVTAHMDPSSYAQTGVPGLIAILDQASAQLGPVTPIAYSQPPNAAGNYAVIEVAVRSGDHFDLVIATSGEPKNLITILTFRPMAAKSSPTASPMASIEIPDTPVGRQFGWFLGLLSGAPVSLSDGDLRSHFSASFLAQLDPSKLTASLTQLSVGYGPISLESFTTPPTDTALEAIVTDAKGARYQVAIIVEAASPNLITSLLINAAATTEAAASWGDFGTIWSSLANESGFLVSELTSSSATPIAGADETRPFAIGSQFKIFVLGALALAIESGHMSWDDKLAIRDDWKSLPSGDTQNLPAGTELTLHDFAAKMISISDNTAADHLLLHLGRTNVETAMARMGMANPRLNSPFLTTRELFALKLVADHTLVDEYVRADSLGRVGLLPEIDALTPSLASAVGWVAPRRIDQIEWFASCNDLANAFAWLANRGSGSKLAPLLDILRINPGVALDAKTWPYIGFKGGSEPGVLTTTWLLRSATGRGFIVSSALNDASRAIDESTAIDAMTKAINLLAKSL